MTKIDVTLTRQVGQAMIDEHATIVLPHLLQISGAEDNLVRQEIQATHRDAAVWRRRNSGGGAHGKSPYPQRVEATASLGQARSRRDRQICAFCGQILRYLARPESARESR